MPKTPPERSTRRRSAGSPQLQSTGSPRRRSQQQSLASADTSEKSFPGARQNADEEDQPSRDSPSPSPRKPKSKSAADSPGFTRGVVVSMGIVVIVLMLMVTIYFDGLKASTLSLIVGSMLVAMVYHRYLTDDRDRNKKSPTPKRFGPTTKESERILELCGVHMPLPEHRQTEWPSNLEDLKLMLQCRPTKFEISPEDYAKCIDQVTSPNEELDMQSMINNMLVQKKRRLRGPYHTLSSLPDFHPNITAPKPDLFDGETDKPDLPKEWDVCIEPVKDLYLPNFFLELKGPAAGDLKTLDRQACKNGAAGAREIHKLRREAGSNNLFDFKAHTITVTYDGATTLAIYATHVTHRELDLSEPDTNALPSLHYHMTRIGDHKLRLGFEQFRSGMTALVRALEWAAEERKVLIAEASAAAGITSLTGISSPQRNSQSPARDTASDQTSVDEIVDDDDIVVTGHNVLNQPEFGSNVLLSPGVSQIERDGPASVGVRDMNELELLFRAMSLGRASPRKRLGSKRKSLVDALLRSKQRVLKRSRVPGAPRFRRILAVRSVASSF